MRRKWGIQLLGDLVAARGRAVVTRFRSQQTAGLLAYLAYHLGQRHPREVLAEVLWPWASPRSGRNGLNTALSCLRSQLELVPFRPGEVIRCDRFAVWLDRQTAQVDSDELRSAVHAATLESEVSTRIQLLERAARIYAGELLPGHYQEWVLEARRRMEDAYFHVVHQLAALLAEHDEVPRALEYAQAAVSLDPLHEGARHDLMYLYAVAGEPAVALRHHAEFTRLLRETTGELPSPGLDHLAYQIKRRPYPTSDHRAARQRRTPTATLCQPIDWADVLDLRRVREELGVGQSRFAELLGTSLRLVQACEDGRRSPGRTLEMSMLLMLVAFRNRTERATHPCWEYRNCPQQTREECFVHRCRQGRLCWAFMGTRCGGRLIRNWRDRKAWCGQCEFMHHLLRIGG